MLLFQAASTSRVSAWQRERDGRCVKGEGTRSTELFHCSSGSALRATGITPRTFQNSGRGTFGRFVSLSIQRRKHCLAFHSALKETIRSTQVAARCSVGQEESLSTQRSSKGRGEAAGVLGRAHWP